MRENLIKGWKNKKDQCPSYDISFNIGSKLIKMKKLYLILLIVAILIVLFFMIFRVGLDWQGEDSWIKDKKGGLNMAPPLQLQIMF